MHRRAPDVTSLSHTDLSGISSAPYPRTGQSGQVTPESRSPDLLEDAVEAGDLEAVRALLDAGANPNTRCQVVDRAVVFVAIQRADAGMVRLLHRYGADLRSASNQPLLHAQSSAFDDNPLIALLVELGLQPDEQDESGWTALHHASSVGYTRNVETLLKSGADPRVATAHGLTAADLANRNGWVETASRLRDA